MEYRPQGSYQVDIIAVHHRARNEAMHHVARQAATMMANNSALHITSPSNNWQSRVIAFTPEPVAAIEENDLPQQWSDLAKLVELHDDDADSLDPTVLESIGLTDEAGDETIVERRPTQETLDSWQRVDSERMRRVHDFRNVVIHGLRDQGDKASIDPELLASLGLTEEDIDGSLEDAERTVVPLSHIPPRQTEQPRFGEVIGSISRWLPRRISSEDFGDLLERISIGALSGRFAIALAVTGILWNSVVYRLREAFRRKVV